MRKIDLVHGLLFGDEGKGKTVQWLCKQSVKQPIVIRFSGGPQAGHNVVKDSTNHIFSSFGSGTLVGVPTMLTQDVFVDPICLCNEYKTLDNPKIFIDPLCLVITPYDVMDNISDAKNLSNGSCGKGIFKVFSRRDLTIREALKDTKAALDKVAKIYPHDIGPLYDVFVESCEMLKEIATVDMSEFVIYKHDHHIYEGSQGLLLDRSYGFMPHCTPSDLFMRFRAGIDDINYYFVSRFYVTRHGNGYNPQYSHILDEYLNFEETTNTDDGYQGVFKKGLFDFRLIQRVIDRVCLDNFKYYNPKFKFNLVLNHFDCFDTCIPYIDKNGNVTTVYKDKIEDFLKEINSIFPFDAYYVGTSNTDNKQIIIL